LKKEGDRQRHRILLPGAGLLDQRGDVSRITAGSTGIVVKGLARSKLRMEIDAWG
jgi:hypothetical protein